MRIANECKASVVMERNSRINVHAGAGRKDWPEASDTL